MSGPRQAVQWCPDGYPPPWPAYYEASELYPGVSPGPWHELAALLRWRGHLSPAAWRLVVFVSHVAQAPGDVPEGEDPEAVPLVNSRGIIADGGEFARCYAAANSVSPVTAWKDIRRLVEMGLLRCLQAAAPGYRSRYRLSYPAAALMELGEHERPLPKELAEKLGVDPDENEADAEQEPETGESSVDEGEEVKTTPSPCTSEIPPQQSAGTGNPGTSGQSPAQGQGQKTSGEKAAAMSLLSACRADWRYQRGYDRVPPRREFAQLAPLVAEAVALLGPSDVLEILSSRVASAENLPRVLRYRLQRCITRARISERRRLSPAEEAERERLVAEAHAARRAAEWAAVEEQRTPASIAARAQALQDARAAMARSSAAYHAADPLSVRTLSGSRSGPEPQRAAWLCYGEEKRTEMPARNSAAGPAVPGMFEPDPYAGALEEIRRLMAGGPEEQRRALALRDATLSRARREARPFG